MKWSRRRMGSGGPVKFQRGGGSMSAAGGGAARAVRVTGAVLLGTGVGRPRGHGIGGRARSGWRGRQGSGGSGARDQNPEIGWKARKYEGQPRPSRATPTIPPPGRAEERIGPPGMEWNIIGAEWNREGGSVGPKGVQGPSYPSPRRLRFCFSVAPGVPEGWTRNTTKN